MTTTNAIQRVINSIEEIPNIDKSASEVVANIESDEIPTCRICMEPQLEDSDPIMPLGCGCRHGLGQAHQNCLIKWFCQRKFYSISKRHGRLGDENCEICKEELSEPSVRGLLNVHWRPFAQQEIANNKALRDSERMAARIYRMTWKEMRYYILAAFLMMVFVGFCIAWAIYS